MSPNASKQLGVRVSKQLAEDFKAVVKYRENATRGPLGETYEFAMQLYLASCFVREPSEFEEFVASVEDPEMEERMFQYFERVGEDLVDTSKALERAAAGGDGATTIDKMGGASITIWHKLRSELFEPDETESVATEDLEKAVETFEALSNGEAEEDVEEVLAKLGHTT